MPQRIVSSPRFIRSTVSRPSISLQNLDPFLPARTIAHSSQPYGYQRVSPYTNALAKA